MVTGKMREGRRSIRLAITLGVALSQAAWSAELAEFHDPGKPLEISVADAVDLSLVTSRRIDQLALHYALETSADLTNEWSSIASYRGDGSPVTFDAPGFGVTIAPIDPDFEELDFYRDLEASPINFYRIAYWWLETIASGQTGEWSTVVWSNGEPVCRMDAVLADGSDVTVSTTDAEANHLRIGTTPAGSSLTVDGGTLTTQGRVVVGSSSNASGTLVVDGGSFTVNAASNANDRFEIGRYDAPVAASSGLSATATFSGGESSLSDVRFNLNDLRSTTLEMVGSEASVRGGALGGNETSPSWINGRLAFTLDEVGVSPLELTGTTDLGADSNHFDLVVDATGYAGEPGVFPLISASSITGDWASALVTGFPSNHTVYLSHTNDNVVLIVDAPIAYYADSVDRTYVRLRSMDGDKVLLHDPASGVLEYASGVGISDFRAHWYLTESPQAGAYWIRNRASGKSIHVSTAGGSSQVILIDFGTDGTYRGASVSSPDDQGNYWNEVGYSPATMDMVDSGNNGTGIDAVMTTSFGTDSYNGPAGDTTINGPEDAVFNAVALGNLGATNAVYDYFDGSAVAFELRGLDPARQYDLTFFGSHKYYTDTVTTYTVSDSNGGVPAASADLTVGVGSAHNQDTVTTITGVTPEAGNTIYVSFGGENGNAGCLNAMQIEVQQAASGSGTNEVQVGDLDPADADYRWAFHSQPGFFRIESVGQAGQYVTVGDAASGTAIHAPLDPADPGQTFVIEPLPPGASVPWTTYDEDNVAAIGNGAVVPPPTYDRLRTRSEAQKRTAVVLQQEGAFARWTIAETADVFVVRYAVADAPAGGGLNGTLAMDIRDGGGVLVESTPIPVSSEQAWVYFDLSMNESDDPSQGRPAKRFNEARVKPVAPMQPGYTLELRREVGDPQIWIDVVETELAGPPITVSGVDYLNVVNYGAIPDDGNDDLSALNACISAATSTGKGVYIPAGVFELSSRVNLGNVVVQGAGMWHTELHYTTQDGGVNTVGFWGEGSNTEVRDLYMRTPSTTRNGGGNAFRQYFGTGSRIANVWAEHFTVGGWIGDYIPPYDVSDGLVFFNCRIRNTFADGINLARGTRNSAIDNCHFRSTGDDSTATWSSDTTTVGMCENNSIRYNTIECTYRAAGVGVFGGEGHNLHHNIVRDVVSGAAMRFNTTFANGAQGYEFSANGTMSVYKNSLYRSGTLSGYGSGEPFGAINLTTTYGNVRNIAFENIFIDDVMNHGVYVNHYTWGSGGAFSNITFDRIRMVRIVNGTTVTPNASGAMEYGDVIVELDPERGITVEDNQSGSFSIIHTGGPIVTNPVIRL